MSETTTLHGEKLAQRVAELSQLAPAALSSGHAEQTDAILQELLSLDAEALGAADVAVVRTVLDIAGRLIPTGRLGAIETLYLTGINVLSAHKQAAVADSFVPLYNLAVLYDQAGAHQYRDNINSTFIARAEALTAPIDAKTAGLFKDLAKVFKSTRPVVILYRHLHRYALSASIDQNACVEIIHDYGQALAADGQHEAALAMYRESLQVLEAAPGWKDHDRMALLFLAGGAARAAGDLAEAQSWLEQASDIALRSEPESRHAGVIYHTLARVYLDRGERLDKAEGLLERACAIAAKTSGENSTEHAGSLAQLAVLFQTKGDADRAVALYRDAFRIYESAPTSNPAEHAAFLSGAGHLHLRLARHEDALAAFLRALDLRQSLPDIDASTLASTMANLATAQFELGNMSGAIGLYRQAVELWFRPSSPPA